MPSVSLSTVATFVPELYVSINPYCPTPAPPVITSFIPGYAVDKLPSVAASESCVVVPC